MPPGALRIVPGPEPDHFHYYLVALFPHLYESLGKNILETILLQASVKWAHDVLTLHR
jgi:hypothetical protein